MNEGVLERIASALERIEARYAGGMNALIDNASLAPGAPGAGPSPEVTTGQGLSEPATALVGEALRESLKTQLRAKGIKFKDAARTETLQKLLVDSEKPSAEDAFAKKPKEEEVKEVTLEMVRNALISLSAAKGKDAALSLLKDKGKTEKLSQVDPTLYAAVYKSCQEKEAV